MALRPRQQNIFDNFSMNYGLDPSLQYGPSYPNSPGMSPSDLPPVNDPFGPPTTTRDAYASTFNQEPAWTPKINFDQIQSSPDLTVQDPRPPAPLDMWERMKSMYEPETYATERLNRLLDTAPQTRGPGLGRGIIAAGMALGNRPTAEIEAFKQAPYLREMTDWTAKSKPFYDAANLERQSNTNERQLVGQMAQYQNQADKTAEQSRIADEKNRISEIRARAYAWKQTHPDYDWYTDGPTIILKKPGTGEIVDTKIPTGQMSEQDLQILKNKGSLAAAQARGSDALTRTREGQWVTFQQGGKTFRVNEATGEVVPVNIPEGTITKPGTPSRATKPDVESPSERQTRMREVYGTNPWAQKHFVRTGNSIELTPRPTSGAKAAEWDKVNKLIYPNYQPPPEVKDESSWGIGPGLDWLKRKVSGGANNAPVYDPSGGLPGTAASGTPPQQAPKPQEDVVGGPPTPNLPPEQRVPAGALKQKAIGLLIQEGKAITEANIRYVVDKGMVK